MKLLSFQNNLQTLERVFGLPKMALTLLRLFFFFRTRANFQENAIGLVHRVDVVACIHTSSLSVWNFHLLFDWQRGKAPSN